jgi:hypothetical protein
VDSPALVNGCGSVDQTLTTDRTTGKVFWVSAYGSNSIAITTFAGDTLTQVGRMTIVLPGMYQYPVKAVRPTSNSVAILTSEGNVVIAQGAFWEP